MSTTLASLSSVEIPEALEELSQKQEYVNEVMQWCESSYATGNKKQVSSQTKEYIVDALESVSSSIEKSCGKLNEFLVLQNKTIDGMATQLDVVKERLAVLKTLNSERRLEKLRTSVDVPRRLEKIQPLTDEEREKHMQVVVSYEKSLEERFKAFEQIGSPSS